MAADETAGLERPKCPNCDFVGVLGARFCSQCGTRLDAPGHGSTAQNPVVIDDASGPIPVVEDLPASGAWLVVRKGPDAGARYPLGGDFVKVGRNTDSDVFLDDVTVSRNHAEIQHDQHGWLLRDKGSLNGTYVNRRLVDEARLANGDEVQIGKYRFIFWAAA